VQFGLQATEEPDFPNSCSRHNSGKKGGKPGMEGNDGFDKTGAEAQIRGPKPKMFCAEQFDRGGDCIVSNVEYARQ
jgi:hypothetical protein